tara:strand:- start:43 stop:630 length:588 start_codon:yes stop_codon:yes gene_type:complete
MELNDLVKVYDNVLDHDTCKSWIEYFESSDEKEKEYNDGYPNWHSLFLYPEDDMEKKIEEYTDIYFKDITKHFEHLTGYDYYPYTANVEYYVEQWKIKRYTPGLDERFDTHVDNINPDTSERFLSFIFYLNDVKEGGETVFEHRKIQPKEGRLIVFPPMWMFPHAGNSPISNTKYIMSTYLRYDEILMEDSDGED